MICLLALMVFGILAIFSASHRPLFKEALDCVFRRISLRPCETSLDVKFKSKVTGKLLKRSPKIASYTFKHFELLSWVFTILLITSLAYTTYGGYNYVKYGNCSGPENNEAFCIFDPSGKHAQYSGIKTDYWGKKIKPTADDDPFIGNKDAKLTIIEFGCFACPYTKKAVPVVNNIVKDYSDVKIVFRNFPLTKTHIGAQESAEASECANEQGKFWQYHDVLFENQGLVDLSNYETLEKFANSLNLDLDKFNQCLISRKYKDEVQKDFEDGVKAGVYGTPTFFIGEKVIVGPHPYEDFKKAIDKALKNE